MTSLDFYIAQIRFHLECAANARGLNDKYMETGRVLEYAINNLYIFYDHVVIHPEDFDSYSKFITSLMTKAIDYKNKGRLPESGIYLSSLILKMRDFRDRT